MAFLKKLLYYYNTRVFVKYGTNVLLFLYFFSIIQIVLIRYNVDYIGSDSGHKYILAWDGYYYMLDKKSNQIFPKLKCRVKNCSFTTNRGLLGGDYTRFDAIIFTENILNFDVKIALPQKRSKSQIYIFTTIESSYNFPACEVEYDDLFNWTFTYRLDSDVHWPYFIVRNTSRHIVAPSRHVQWQEYDKGVQVPPQIRNFFRHRTKAAAWVVSHCNADSSRDDYLTRLQEHLYHFAIQIDVYGGCSNVKCTNDNCAEMIRRDYYFYMAFENSFAEDYVTEKVLHGYSNYVVPIVYGGANYTRFLPPGSYINARKIHPYNLAYIMHEAMKNPEKYNEYFKWANYYTVDTSDEFSELHPLCNLCKALNSERILHHRRQPQFRRWWNGLKGMQWCLPTQFWNETSLLRVDRRDFIDMY